MGHRHDPCVLYTLISVKHFLKSGEALPWWNFTAEGKNLLKSSKSLALDSTLPLGQPSATELSISHNVRSKRKWTP
jgi:hypothetical protein